MPIPGEPVVFGRPSGLAGRLPYRGMEVDGAVPPSVLSEHANSLSTGPLSGGVMLSPFDEPFPEPRLPPDLPGPTIPGPVALPESPVSADPPRVPWLPPLDRGDQYPIPEMPVPANPQAPAQPLWPSPWEPNRLPPDPEYDPTDFGPVRPGARGFTVPAPLKRLLAWWRRIYELWEHEGPRFFVAPRVKRWRQSFYHAVHAMFLANWGGLPPQGAPPSEEDRARVDDKVDAWMNSGFTSPFTRIVAAYVGGPGTLRRSPASPSDIGGLLRGFHKVATCTWTWHELLDYMSDSLPASVGLHPTMLRDFGAARDQLPPP